MTGNYTAKAGLYRLRRTHLPQAAWSAQAGGHKKAGFRGSRPADRDIGPGLGWRPGIAQVLSFTVVLAPFAFTEAMPASRAASSPYIWLVPITWWLAAFRLKYGFPLLAALRS